MYTHCIHRVFSCNVYCMLSIFSPDLLSSSPPAQPPPLVPFISLGSSASTHTHTWFSIISWNCLDLSNTTIYSCFHFLSNNFHLLYGGSKSSFTSPAFSCHSSAVGHLGCFHNSTIANTAAINFWPGLNCPYIPFFYRVKLFIQDSFLYFLSKFTRRGVMWHMHTCMDTCLGMLWLHPYVCWLLILLKPVSPKRNGELGPEHPHRILDGTDFRTRSALLTPTPAPLWKKYVAGLGFPPLVRHSGHSISSFVENRTVPRFSNAGEDLALPGLLNQRIQLPWNKSITKSRPACGDWFHGEVLPFPT